MDEPPSGKPASEYHDKQCHVTGDKFRYASTEQQSGRPLSEYHDRQFHMISTPLKIRISKNRASLSRGVQCTLY